MENNSSNQETILSTGDKQVIKKLPEEVFKSVDRDIKLAGGEFKVPPEFEGAVGFTMFDSPASEDNTVVMLQTKENLGAAPSQAMVRIKSISDGRSYLGVVVKGPFAEPDGLRADAPMLVIPMVRGSGIFLPNYHGRLNIEILGEEIEGGLGLIPPRFRPRPNSPVFLLNTQETISALKVSGSIQLGLVVGHEDICLCVPSDKKSVFPRHTGIIGTTGSGKSTTVARLISEARRDGFAIVLLDVEGEYTEIDKPTEDSQMLKALERRNLQPAGVPNTHIYHLIGRETANPDHTSIKPFSLRFSALSPYAVMEILDLSEAQQDRFWKTYEVTKNLLRDFGIFPQRGNKDEQRQELELNEFDSGYPRMTLSQIIDIANAFFHKVSKSEGEPQLYNAIFRENFEHVKERVNAVRTSHEMSWLALIGQLWRLYRLGVFDIPRSQAIDYSELIKSGHVSIIDLSDTDSPQLNNLVIADILRGVQRAQEEAYQQTQTEGKNPPKVLIIIEEAHEFLSQERIDRMPVLFEQVARIAKRGRKRWLGLVFVTQLPQHLPAQVFGLLNNYILHKLSDSSVISRLQRSIGGIDDNLWKRLTGLAPGQAITSFTSMARPLLVGIDPTPCKLRLIE